MTMWFENQRGEQFRIDTVSDDSKTVDAFFDQLNLRKFKFITQNDFKVTNPMTIDVKDGDIKLGELTFATPPPSKNTKHSHQP